MGLRCGATKIRGGGNLLEQREPRAPRSKLERRIASGLRLGSARLDLLTVIVLLLILFALASPVQGIGDDVCPPPPGSVPVHLDGDLPDGAPCDSEAPCPADEGCTVCATCCKVAVRSSAPPTARTADPPGFPLAVPFLAAAGPCGSVWHPPRG